MAGQQTAEEVRDRFVNEQDYIKRYAAFLLSKSSINDREIIRLNVSLRRYGFRPFPYRPLSAMARSFPALSHQDLLGLVSSINELEPEVRNAAIESNGLLNDAPCGEIPTDNIHLNKIAYEMEQSIDSVLRITGRLSSETVTKVEVFLREVAEGNNLQAEVATEVVRTALHFWLNDKVEELENLLRVFEQIRIMARSAAPDAEINVLRQGFILLMTAFDATIFDLVQVALTNKFFSLAGAFGKQDKLSVSEIAASGTFDNLRDKLIEEQLKKRYIKDLLGLLNDAWGVSCVDPLGNQKAERLTELVLRRNLHVHNRGVVDARYVNDKNLDGLKVGEVAVIDEAYWEMANKLCIDCVERVTAWARA